MFTPGLYFDLKRTPLASAILSKKVHTHGIQFLTDLGLQGHQNLMAGSLDLYPKNAPYGIVQRIQMWGTWGPNGPESVLCQIYFIKAWVVLALCMEPGSVLLY